jgi:hypothetical protein
LGKSSKDYPEVENMLFRDFAKYVEGSPGQGCVTVRPTAFAENERNEKRAERMWDLFKDCLIAIASAIFGFWLGKHAG